MKRIVISCFCALFVMLSVPVALASKRARPHPEEYFTERCALIFVGKVLEIDKRELPSKYKVILSIKGNVPLKEMDVLPNKFAGQFKEEFDKTQKGKIGVFFIKKEDSGYQYLAKFKEIPDAEEASDKEKAEPRDVRNGVYY